MKISKRKTLGMTSYLLFLLVPIYWLLNMSFKRNEEILGALTLWPQNFTFDNYIVILSDPSWYMGYVNSMIYVAMNMVINSSCYLILRMAIGYAQSSASPSRRQPTAIDVC